MGFISSSSTLDISAYLTYAGRKAILSGQTSDSQIKFFTLGDSDVDYNIAKETLFGSPNKNILTSGFVPDLTGDNNGCIKSLADGITIRYALQSGIVAPAPAPTTPTTPVPTPTTPVPTPPTPPVPVPVVTTTYQLVLFTGTTTSNYITDGKSSLNAIVNLDVMMQWSLYNASISPFLSSTAYNTFDPNLKSPFADFYKSIKLKRIVSSDDGDNVFIEDIDNRVYYFYLISIDK